jgi:ABC-type oligopeptide transport system substrate-binding subunit
MLKNILVSALAGFTVLSSCVHAQPEPPKMKAIFPLKIKKAKIDPQNYREYAHQSLVQHLYSPLVEYNSKAQIVGGIAKAWRWEDSSLVFTLRDGVHSSKGQLVESQDVFVSLKRIANLNFEKYSQIFTELCPTRNNQEQRTCENIKIDSPQQIRLSFKTKKPAFLDLFTSIDFAIVPRSALSESDWHIEDIFNNTGPYKLLVFNEDSNLVEMSARKDHWHWKSDIPQLVEFKTYLDKDGAEISAAERLKLFLAGEADLIGTYASLVRVTEAIEDPSKYNIFKSNYLSVYTFFFSKKGLRDFSVEQRHAISYHLKKLFATRFDSVTKKPEGLFPPVSDGGLSTDQIDAWEKRLESASKIKLPRKVLFHTKTYMPDIRELLDKDKEIFEHSIDNTYTFPGSAEQQEKFDGFFGRASLSAIESADSLFFLKGNGWLMQSEESINRLIKTFLESDSRSERIGILQGLHNDIITQARVIPLEATFYSAVVRKPWKFNFSKAFTDTLLWQITYEP